MPVSTRRTRQISRQPLPTELLIQILKDRELSPLDIASCCFVNRLFRSISLRRLPIDENLDLTLLTDEPDDSRIWYLNEDSDSVFSILERFPPLGQLVTSATLFRKYSDLLDRYRTLPDENNTDLTEEEREALDAYAEAVEEVDSTDTIPAKNAESWDAEPLVERCLELMPNLKSFEFGEDVWADGVEEVIRETAQNRRRWEVKGKAGWWEGIRIERRNLVK